MKHIDPEKREEWLFQMNQPLPGEPVNRKPTASELEADAAAFMAAMQMKKG